MSRPRIVMTGITQGARGPQGLPGPNAIPTDAAVAAYIANPTSDTYEALIAGEFGGTDEAAVGVIAGALDDLAVARQAFGYHGGTPIQPWKQSDKWGIELWTTARLHNGGANFQVATASPTVTANGSPQQVRSHVSLAEEDSGLPLPVAGDYHLRLEFDITTTIASGGWWVAILWTDIAGATAGGSIKQYVASPNTPNPNQRVILDLEPPIHGSGPYFEIELKVENNVPNGQTLGISNVSLKTVDRHTRPLYIGTAYNDASVVQLFTTQQDSLSKTWKTAVTTFTTEGDLVKPRAYSTIDGYETDKIFASNPPDPLMLVANDYDGGLGRTQVTASPSRTLRFQNNDQIIEVWNGSAWELRGNVHNGEFARGAAAWQIDKGAGFVSWTPALGAQNVWRIKGSLPSEMRRSVDGTTPFCNVDRTFTAFRDGMVRMDRKTTFLVDTQVRNYFELMTTHGTDPFIGRMGRGSEVSQEYDAAPRIATPGTVTPSTSGSGGTLAAGTYSYRVTALTPYGETLPSAAASQVTTGSTSTVTLSWSAVTSATGYRVYGRSAGVERHLTTVTATTWIDTGALAPSTTQAPAVSTARLYGTGNLTAGQIADGDISWAVWREPRSRWCYGNIYDRTAILSRPLVSGVWTRMSAAAGINQKQYNLLHWASGLSQVTIPAGTEFSATHWFYTYQPVDQENWHREIAIRGANSTALASLYPAT